MQYALIDSRRSEARPSARGECPVCGSPVIARCGEIRVHHWAHRGERKCDHWWEPETAWHRLWKERFDPAWREFIQRAADGEKHIADVCSPSGRVIEFQHSFLNPDERRAREAFYGNMVWVVNGMRRKRDRKRFVDAASRWKILGKRAQIFVTSRPEEGLPVEWLGCAAPVFVDFGDEVFLDARKILQRPTMWSLLPGRVLGHAVVVEISKQTFIDKASNDSPIFDWLSLREKVERHLHRQQLETLLKRAAMIKRMSRYLPSRSRPTWQRRRRTARF